MQGRSESQKRDINIQPHHLSADGSLMLYCEVKFLPYSDNKKPDNNEFKSNHSASNNTSQKLLNNMLEQGTLSDCLIKIGKETINVHRCILAQNSKVFLRMFEQKDMTEAQNAGIKVLNKYSNLFFKGEIEIVDSSPECFRAMIEYFYNGEIAENTFEKLVDDLFVISHKYEVLKLMDKCENFMALNIDNANFSKRSHYAELYNLSLLKNACIKYISVKRDSFLVSNEWNEFKENKSSLAVNLLESALKQKFF
uniref:BTB domain-containing protein n=1 Tax=Meloidogyne enterolobii TaxID=390850 RepID=A0A6V7X6Y0_MELEN|nr:unnamed protein product [Meloidogyne enterolobii]CAD2195110.1 unnamed protein product [Meloidogyne enterolobii]CAD2205531.1 unnamed protein product [Meloidogyne enterolobii]